MALMKSSEDTNTDEVAMDAIVLVTPVWNDSGRLDRFGRVLAATLAAEHLPIRWVIADDGSRSEEVARYEALRDDFAEIYPAVDLLRIPVRSRKGGAIYAAWKQFPDADYYAFVDADGAVSPESMVDLIRSALKGGSSGAVVGVRVVHGPLAVQRSLLRMGTYHLFRFLVRLIIGIRFRDTQCGAKVVGGKAYRSIANRLREEGFIFDAELLAALQQSGVRIEEVPIAWREVQGSRIRLSRDFWEMLKGLFRIRKRLEARLYDAPSPLR